MSRFLSAFGPAFVAIGFLCAPIAALVTFAVYELWSQTGWSIGAGLAAGLASSLIVWVIYEKSYRMASAVYPEQYQDLILRLQTDGNLLDASTSRADPCAIAAKKDADHLRTKIGDLLNKQQAGAIWISATGYLDAWTCLYRLEEAAIQLLPAEKVLAMARDDISRLAGSAISQRDGLTERLTAAIKNLLDAKAPGATPAFGADEVSARADIAGVRNKINRYREDKWSGLLADRNRIMLATAIAGLLAYLALVSVVFRHIDQKALQVAGSFIITGGLVSLLHQATVVGTSDSGVEDFGQSTARLLSATFVSSVIALLGVIVLEGAGLTINGSPVFPSFTHWRDTFDWTQNKSGFFWAALFGFAPSLLFGILQNRADGIKSSLESTRATGATPSKS